MAKYLPEMKQLMDKKVTLGLNGSRRIEGTLRGYDQFMNVVLDDCVELARDGQRRPVGMTVIRGNSVLTMETKPLSSSASASASHHHSHHHHHSYNNNQRRQ